VSTAVARVLDGFRHPIRWLQELVGDGPVYPLLILFGLNAVDELDRTGFGILLPEIRDAFDLDLQGILTLIAVVGVGSLAMQVPIAYLADRRSRVHITLIGAALWAVFSFATGLAFTVWALVVFRIGSGIGRAVVEPTHNSLLADYYAPEVRPRVYSFHRAANSVGQFLGPLLAGLIAFSFGWRWPFFVFAIPTFVLVILGLRMREPIRGAQERRAMGASDAVVATAEEPPSYAEAWRMMWKITSLRRIWYSMPFLAISFVGFVSLAALLYEDVFGLDERARGFIAASVEPMQIIGLIIGARVATRLLARDPGLALKFQAGVAFVVGGLFVLFALAPNIYVAVVLNALITMVLAVLLPGILAALSLAIPARARSLGFSIASLWVIPGLVLLPLLGAIGDAWGLRVAMLLMVPVLVIGGLVISRAGWVIKGDIEQVWRAGAARSEVLYERNQGRSKLLLVRGLDVSYGNVQVLFDVDFEVGEGEIVALLGTNGAGKSTFLRTISGVLDPDRGAVILDGRDLTFAPANEVAARGVTMIPAGAGVFPSLTIRENLEVAGWLARHDRDDANGSLDRIYTLFPQLRARASEPAANLSGGQQQMLALGMALRSRPRLLCIDELSLGLAPIVVEQLLELVRELNAAGVTIIIVEQSVSVALSVAETAYFMEKGQIRFHGRTDELLERPDVLRSVFLEGAVAAATVRGNGGAVARPDTDDSPATPATPTEPPAGDRLGGLSTVGLSRHFGGIAAIDDVTVEVAEQEIVGVIGPNGAGKTTLLDVISGYTPAEGGRVFLGAEELTGLSPQERARRGLGRSFQDARLFPALTVEEAIAVALDRSVAVRNPLAAALHLPSVFDSEQRVADRVSELIEIFGLDAFRTKFLRELSTGSRRVVDLACVLAHRPNVVLLDEPSSGIAQRETEALAPLLRRVRDELGASLVVVEHDMPLVSAIADRLVALDQGRVIAVGDPPRVLTHPVVIESYLGTNEDLLSASKRRRS
jgi:ABC-type branched-subunit amino acid transport system ATPase component/predicted MFS family arabinose efflux permease